MKQLFSRPLPSACLLFFSLDIVSSRTRSRIRGAHAQALQEATFPEVRIFLPGTGTIYGTSPFNQSSIVYYKTLTILITVLSRPVSIDLKENDDFVKWRVSMDHLK